jgi:tetratricopeptide (TPR) repeat protein
MSIKSALLGFYKNPTEPNAMPTPLNANSTADNSLVVVGPRRYVSWKTAAVLLLTVNSVVVANIFITVKPQRVPYVSSLVTQFRNIIGPATISQTVLQRAEKLVKHRETSNAEFLVNSLLEQPGVPGDLATYSTLLYLKGRIHSQKAEFESAVACLQKSIDIAKTLNRPQLLLAPVLTLATVSHVTNDNHTALLRANECLELSFKANNLAYQAASMQMLAISKFFLEPSADVEAVQLLEQSIALAERSGNFEAVAQNYVYLGVISTEKSQLAKANIFFEKALSVVPNIADSQSQVYTEATIKGHFARTQALGGNAREAVELYTAALEAAQKAGVRQYLALSQLNQGLGESYQALGDQRKADKAFYSAELYEKEALFLRQSSNKLLSFAPIHFTKRD